MKERRLTATMPAIVRSASSRAVRLGTPNAHGILQLASPSSTANTGTCADGCACVTCRTFSGQNGSSAEMSGRAKCCSCTYCSSEGWQGCVLGVSCQCPRCLYGRCISESLQTDISGFNTSQRVVGNFMALQQQGMQKSRAVTGGISFHSIQMRSFQSANHQRHCLLCHRAPCTCSQSCRAFSTVEQQHQDKVLHFATSTYAAFANKPYARYLVGYFLAV